jgi:hypothetical protein
VARRLLAVTSLVVLAAGVGGAEGALAVDAQGSLAVLDGQSGEVRPKSWQVGASVMAGSVAVSDRCDSG